MKQEENLHLAVCNYIRMQYPKIIFNTDLSGIKMTMGQAVKVQKLRSSKGFPDIVIYKATFDEQSNNHYFGLFIELKKEGEKIFKRDGSTPVSDHIAEQIEMIEKLNSEGYYGTFCIGFNQAKNIIDWYLGIS